MGVFTSFRRHINEWLEMAFFHVAGFLYKRTLLSIFSTLLIGIALAAGLIFQNAETNTLKLWVPQDSAAFDDRDFIKDHYGSGSDKSTIFVMEARNGDVLSRAFWDEVFDVHEEINAMKDKNGKILQDVCSRPTDQRCYQADALAFFNYSRSEMHRVAEDNLWSETLVTGTPYDFGYLDLESFMFGDLKVTSDGALISASAVQLSYFVENSGSAWIDTYLKEMEKIQDRDWKGRVYYHSWERFDSQIEAALGADVQLAFVAIAVMICFVILALGHPFSAVLAQYIPSLVGVTAVMLAVYAANGLLGYLGVVYASPNDVLPFLLLGIGVDDMFIIVAALQSKKGTILERMQNGLSEAGITITYTSLSSTLAFLFGLSSVLPAIASFCAHAATAVFLDFVFQITLFTAFYKYDMKRVEANRLAIMPAIKTSRKPKERKEVSRYRRVVREWIAPAITTNAVYQIFTTLGVLGLLVIGVTGTLQLERQFDLREIVLQDSWAHSYLTIIDERFDQRELANLYVLEEVDYRSEKWANRIDATLTSLEDDLEANLAGSWLGDYKAYRSATGLPDGASDGQWLSDLRLWLDRDGVSYSSNVIFTRDGSGIRTSRFSVILPATPTSNDQNKAMLDARKIVQQELGNSGAIFTEQYLYYEADSVIVQELITNIILATTAIFLVTLILIGDLWAAILIVFMIAIIEVDLLGIMYYWDLSINSVTVINLIMAVGFAVDYSAHILHAFTARSGTRLERSQAALGELGPSVAKGGFSTLVGVMFLALGRTGIFEAFFKMLFSVVLLGLYHGLCFLPIILRYAGPKGAQPMEEDEENPQKNVSMNHSSSLATTSAPATSSSLETTSTGSETSNSACSSSSYTRN